MTLAARPQKAARFFGGAQARDNLSLSPKPQKALLGYAGGFGRDKIKSSTVCPARRETTRRQIRLRNHLPPDSLWWLNRSVAILALSRGRLSRSDHRLCRS